MNYQSKQPAGQDVAAFGDFLTANPAVSGFAVGPSVFSLQSSA
jgi:hypothetical protein